MGINTPNPIESVKCLEFDEALEAVANMMGVTKDDIRAAVNSYPLLGPKFIGGDAESFIAHESEARPGEGHILLTSVYKEQAFFQMRFVPNEDGAGVQIKEHSQPPIEDPITGAMGLDGSDL